MPVPPEIDLSAFLGACARRVADVGRLSDEMGARCSLSGHSGDAEARVPARGDAALGVTLARGSLGRIGLAALETERPLQIADVRTDRGYVIGFALSGTVQVMVRDRSGILLCREGDGAILERRRLVAARLEAGTRLLLLDVPDTILSVAAAPTLGSRLYGPLDFPPFMPAASRCATHLRYASALCANDLAVSGSALRGAAYGRRFERFVLRALLAELGPPRAVFSPPAPRHARAAAAVDCCDAA